MDKTLFLKKINIAFSKKLPGIEAHKKLSPSKRPFSSSEIHNIHEYKKSAVGIICFPINNKIHIIVIQRPNYEGKHGGQISFPGGKFDITDKDLEFTARREIYEEIGWQLTPEHLLGKLSEIYIPVSQFIVQPFLYYIDSPQIYKPNQREVEEIIEFPIQELIIDDNVKITNIKQSNVILKNISYFSIHNKIIWGATAIILSELKEMIKT